MYSSSHVRFREFVAWNTNTVVFIVIVQLVFKLLMLLLAAVINPSLLFGIYSLNSRVDVLTLSSILLSPLPPSFFLTHIVCLCHVSDMRPCVSSSLLSSGSFVWFPSLTILRMVLSTAQGILFACLFLFWHWGLRNKNGGGVYGDSMLLKRLLYVASVLAPLTRVSILNLDLR